MAPSRRICIVSADDSPDGENGAALRRRAEALGKRHEVTLIEGPEPTAAITGLSFASEDHRRAAAVLAAIERAYDRERPPHYLEVCDHRAPGLVALQARAAGHELLRGTTVGVRLTGTAELLALHNGRATLSEELRVADLEREQLRLADRLLWPGGDALDRYRAHYADLRLPPALRVGRPFPQPQAPPSPPSPSDGPLRILCAGPLERRKGVLELVEACLGLPGDEWQLSLIGADTATAPMAQSVQLTIEVMSGGDPRVSIEGPLPREELRRRFDNHDLLVIPSTFETCADVALEALRAGLPVLTTPVGAHVEAIEPGVSGWLTEGTGAAALRHSLAALLDERDALAAVRASGQVFEGFRRFTDPQASLEAYDELLAEEPRTPAPRPDRQRVTAVVPYYRAHPYVREAVASLLGQTHPDLDLVLVNDGGFDREDEVLEELAADPRVRLVHQLNRGDASARNLGTLLAAGEYLMMFDADNLLEPEFVARALAMHRADPELAYVTCWLRFVDPEGEELDGSGYAPLGNRVLGDEGENWDGDTIALISRRALERLSSPYDPRASIHSDWNLYRRLRERGEYGAVIPELLAERDALAGRLEETEAALERTRADRDGLERQNQELAAAVARLSVGLPGVLRRIRGRLLNR